ncbi:MAG: 2,3-bisphosphoglycerate-independent phosphoglycerate mutase [bacterium]
MERNLITSLATTTQSKIILVVFDGLGGLPKNQGEGTELETAHTPNLDALAARSVCGLVDPISMGITPGSGPAHLGLFGYDPLQYEIGRGILSALGVDFDLKPSDVAARINFAQADAQGNIIDRRAGRIPTEKNRQLCELLSQIHIEGVEIFLRPEKEHRAAIIFRGADLSGQLSDTDPQKTGVPPRQVEPLTAEAHRTAEMVNQFVKEAQRILSREEKANMILLRGFDKYEAIPGYSDRYRLKAAAIATYPMYRGLARLLGMTVLPTGDTIRDEFETLTQFYQQHDFFFLHIKKTDSMGEDGNFEGKVKVIEEADQCFPYLLKLQPDVIAVTGDHSTPSVLKSHSWHPNPVLLYSEFCRPDQVRSFSESACIHGGLGRFPALHLMPLMMANALKLEKYGA